MHKNCTFAGTETCSQCGRQVITHLKLYYKWKHKFQNVELINSGHLVHRHLCVLVDTYIHRRLYGFHFLIRLFFSCHRHLYGCILHLRPSTFVWLDASSQTIDICMAGCFFFLIISMVHLYGQLNH